MFNSSILQMDFLELYYKAPTCFIIISVSARNIGIVHIIEILYNICILITFWGLFL